MKYPSIQQFQHINLFDIILHFSCQRCFTRGQFLICHCKILQSQNVSLACGPWTHMSSTYAC
uniref:Uncharacterized protein n=1 Tax=Arundo donax TaxID=35708 RepID=A0A0A9HDD7_ARUDO